jgi:hypothetical protein
MCSESENKVHVVAGVADQGHALLVARHVAAARAEQEFRRVLEVEQVGRADRAVRVEHLQGELRGAGVVQRFGFAAGVDGGRSAVMSCAISWPKNGHPAASVASSAPVSSPSRTRAASQIPP